MTQTGQPTQELIGSEVDVESAPHKIKKVPVVEIFGPTVQGEGFMIGERTTFIRFGLCDYKCKMCDSMHAVDPMKVRQNAKWMNPEDIVEELLNVQAPDGQLAAQWVTFSGGNPCIHDLSRLIWTIRGLDLTHGEIKIAVETQGTFLPDWLHWCDVITVSPKSPGMGEKFERDKFLNFVMTFKHHKGFNVKVVIFSMADMEWATEVNNLMVDEGLGDRVYFSLGNPCPPGHPNTEELAELTPDNLGAQDDNLKLKLLRDYRVLTEDFLQMPQFINVKFLPQLHVLVWANKQGV